MIDRIKPQDFDKAVTLLRNFFKDRNYTEAHVQHRLSILAACEDPTTIGSFDYNGQVWPLPQTGQMQLEEELLRDPNLNSIFTVTTSYRQEANPVEGRHSLIFPMFEFESRGEIEDLIQLEADLCQYLHIVPPQTIAQNFEKLIIKRVNGYPVIHYEDAANFFQVQILEAEHEERLQNIFGNVVFLTHFTEDTSPFWNMKREEHTAKKVDVIIYGIETIGSAERETDPQMMRQRFYEISDGEYAKLLFAHFGKERVEQELNEFLAHKFFPRFGGGMGMTRLIRALKLNG